MNNSASLFIDVSGTLSNKVQFFVQHKKYYGLTLIIPIIYKLFMMNKKNKTRLSAWGADHSNVLSFFLSATQADNREFKKGAK